MDCAFEFDYCQTYEELEASWNKRVAPAPCLHQIQEPAAAEQAAWHADLDEGRAQAAPAAVAVPDDWKMVPLDLTPEMKREFMDLLMDGIDIYVNRRDQIEIQTDAPRRIWKAVLALAPSAPADALATPTGLPAQAVEMPDFDLRTSKGGRDLVAWYFANVLGRHDFAKYISNTLAADFACALAQALRAPQAQADAREAQLLAFAVSEIRRDEMTDSELLDAMEQKRIAVVPEYEGPWDAEVYNDEGEPIHAGSGSTPREAIRAAIAAAKGE